MLLIKYSLPLWDTNIDWIWSALNRGYACDYISVIISFCSIRYTPFDEIVKHILHIEVWQLSRFDSYPLSGCTKLCGHDLCRERVHTTGMHCDSITCGLLCFLKPSKPRLGGLNSCMQCWKCC